MSARKDFGLYDQCGKEGDIRWAVTQKDERLFEISATNIKKGFSHVSPYQLIRDPVFGLDVDDISAINALLAKVISIAKTGNLIV